MRMAVGREARGDDAVFLSKEERGYVLDTIIMNEWCGGKKQSYNYVQNRQNTAYLAAAGVIQTGRVSDTFT